MNPDFFKAMAGFLGAGVSFCASFIADVVPPNFQPGYEGITSISVIGCLIYAVKHLNKERTEERRLRDVDRDRWEAKWSAEHAENLDAREKDRLTRESLADAVDKLADAVKPSR